MSTEENKSVVRRYYDEVWNSGDFSAAEAIIAPNYLYHGMPEMHGLSGLKEMFTGAHTSFPDLHFTIEELIAEGDKVVSRWQAVGTNEGEFMGIPATGKKVLVAGVVISRLVDGKVAEEWESWDELGALRQLGATSIPPQSGR